MNQDKTNDLNTLEMKIADWGLARNITPSGGVTAQDQVSKLIEELAECVSTLGKIKDLQCEMSHASGQEYLDLYEDYKKRQKQLDDDFGDMRVCIIQAERLAGTCGAKTLNAAWNDIKDRKGKMVDGKFVKESV